MPQRVLITAGAAGIGREFARAFAATGSSVFVCDIDAKALEAIADAAEALASHFALMKADGDAIPAPRSFEQLRRDPEFIDDSADAIVTMVTPRTEMAAAE